MHAPMHIGSPIDLRAYITGAAEMLTESAKQFRVMGLIGGHESMCEAHALRLRIVLRQLDHTGDDAIEAQNHNPSPNIGGTDHE